VSRALLAGVTVLDLSLLLPGPLATWHLRSLGAKVVKIEPPSGAYARNVGPLEGTTSRFYQHLNFAKESLSLDLSQEVGKGIFFERLRQADVVIESFRPGVMERLGLGFERLRELNPRLCLVSISGYGRGGALARMAGHDINYLALSGWLHELIPDEGEPVLPGVQIADVLGGALTAALATISAVLYARSSGKGSHVDVSMTAALLANNVLPLVHAQASMPAPRPGKGLLNGGVPCYGLYRTGDGRYLAVGALEAKFWMRLCKALDRDEWSDRHWQSGQEAGGEDASTLRGELARLFAAAPLAHWQQVFAEVDCCVTPVLRMDEVLQHPVWQDYLARGSGVSVS
jgi:crotonobetainyl-CoA:carnitine CoA-transferase CaiB-like acyl-CoA transferase